MLDPLSTVKKVLKALMISMPSPTGIPVRALLSDYTNVEEGELPYASFGFSNAIDFLLSLTDTLQIHMSNGELYARPIVHQGNAHVGQLVLEQGQQQQAQRTSGFRRWNSKPSHRNAAAQNCRMPSPPRMTAYQPMKRPANFTSATGQQYHHPSAMNCPPIPPRVQQHPSTPLPSNGYEYPPLPPRPNIHAPQNVSRATTSAHRSLGSVSSSPHTSETSNSSIAADNWPEANKPGPSIGETKFRSMWEASTVTETGSVTTAPTGMSWCDNGIVSSEIASTNPFALAVLNERRTPTAQVNVPFAWAWNEHAEQASDCAKSMECVHATGFDPNARSVGFVRYSNDADLKFDKSTIVAEEGESKMPSGKVAVYGKQQPPNESTVNDPMYHHQMDKDNANPDEMEASRNSSAADSHRETRDHLFEANLNVPEEHSQPLKPTSVSKLDGRSVECHMDADDLAALNANNVSMGGSVDTNGEQDTANTMDIDVHALNQQIDDSTVDNGPLSYRQNPFISSQSQQHRPASVANGVDGLNSVQRPQSSTDATETPQHTVVRPPLLQAHVRALEKEQPPENVATLVNAWHNQASSVVQEPKVEALPKFFEDMWSEFPDMAPCDAKYKREMPPHLNQRAAHIKLNVVEMNNPYKFWFQLDGSVADLDLVMENMNEFYNGQKHADLSIADGLLKAGQICAALYCEKWHRAEILDVYEHERQVKLLFVDYGTVDEIDTEHIRFIKKDFIELPAQAIRGCLDEVKPCAGVWHPNNTVRLIDMVLNRNLYGTITHIDKQEEIVHLKLSETTHLNDVSINEQFVMSGYARSCLPLHARPKRLYAEVYPTFKMLESGEYPSYNEIADLLDIDDFDLVAYEESIIIPAMFGYSSI